MKIVIERTETNEIIIYFDNGEQQYKFDYIYMVKYLYKNKKFDEVIYKGSVSQEEKTKIDSMFEDIYKAVEEA